MEFPAGISAEGAQELIVYNESSASITFINSSGSASAANRILSVSGNLTLAPGYCLSFVYDNTAQLWIPQLSGAGGGGGGGGSITLITTSTPALGITNGAGPTTDLELANATDSVAGLMSAADKTKLDGLSPGSVTYNVNKFTLTGGDISAMQVTLTGTPTQPALSILQPLYGVVQEYSVDYTISSNILSWSGLGLQSYLTSGDKLIIQFF